MLSEQEGESSSLLYRRSYDKSAVLLSFAVRIIIVEGDGSMEM